MPDWPDVTKLYNAGEVAELETTPEGRVRLSAWAYQIAEIRVRTFEQSRQTPDTLNLSALSLYPRGGHRALRYLNRVPPSIMRLRGLRRLYLRGTNVSSLSWLAVPASQSESVLSTTGSSDLSSLDGLRLLETLTLRKSPVTDLSPLAQLISLRQLDIGQTQVRDLSPLAGLKALWWIDFNATPALKRDPGRKYGRRHPELKRIVALPDDGTRATALLAYLNSGDYRPPAYDDTSRASLKGEYISIANADVHAIRADAADLKAVLTENLEYARRYNTDKPPNALPSIFVDFEQLDDEFSQNLKAIFQSMIDLLDRFDKLLQSKKPSDKILADLRRLWLEQHDTLKRDVMLWLGTTGVATAAYTVAPPIALLAMLFGLPVLSESRRALELALAIAKTRSRGGRAREDEDSE